MDRSEQHVEGVAGEEAGDVVHPVPVVVDLEAEHHRQPSALPPDHLDVGVEIGPGVVVPVGGHPGAEPARRVVLPETASRSSGLGEAEEMLGHRDLDDPRGGARSQ